MRDSSMIVNTSYTIRNNILLFTVSINNFFNSSDPNNNIPNTGPAYFSFPEFVPLGTLITNYSIQYMLIDVLDPVYGFMFFINNMNIRGVNVNFPGYFPFTFTSDINFESDIPVSGINSIDFKNENSIGVVNAIIRFSLILNNPPEIPTDIPPILLPTEYPTYMPPMQPPIQDIPIITNSPSSNQVNIMIIISSVIGGIIFLILLFYMA